MNLSKKVALGLSTFLVSAIAHAVTINNAGFEDGFSGWNDDEPSAISSGAYSGKASAKITGAGGRVDQTVKLSKNTDYVLTAYVEDHGEIGINLGTSTESVKYKTDGWNKVTVSFNSGSATSGEVFGKYYSGQGRFDDFKLISEGSASSDDELTASKAFDYGTSESGFPASNAIDDNTDFDSRWAAKNGGGDVNLVLQLPEAQHVTDVGVAWADGDSRAYTFEIYARPGTSGDWTKVADTVSSGDATSIQRYDILDIDAKQVRIKTQSNTAGSDLTNIAEVKLYGSEDTVDDGDSGDSGNVGNKCASSGQILYNGSCEEYSEVFEVESGDLDENAHIISLSPIQMTFDALAAKHITKNGNGWRHEIKIKSKGGYRVPMADVYEDFKAKITANLDPGAKTIVAQHHTESIDTITKLYIADLNEGGFESAPDGTKADGVAMNGIFDVYIRLAKADGSGESKHLLTTITKGESFYFEEKNDHGKVTVTINGKSLSPITVDDSSESYFKFGNYLQAQYPASVDGHKIGDKLAKGDADGDFADFYKKFFDVGEITFTEMSYTRTLD